MFSTACLAVDPQCRVVYLWLIRLDIYIYIYVIKKDLIPLCGRIAHKSGRCVYARFVIFKNKNYFCTTMILYLVRTTQVYVIIGT